MASVAASHPPGHVQLLRDQRSGLAAWRRLRDREEATCSRLHLTREQRLDAARRLEALRRQESALRQQVESAHAWHVNGGSPVARAVVAHHELWLRSKLVVLLGESGLEVRAVPTDGAACIGVCAAEQPDVLVLSDPVTMMTALEVVSACREVSPATRIVVHSEAPETADALREAGAAAVLSRHLPPADVVADLTSTLGLT